MEKVEEVVITQENKSSGVVQHWAMSRPFLGNMLLR